MYFVNWVGIPNPTASQWVHAWITEIIFWKVCVCVSYVYLFVFTYPYEQNFIKQQARVYGGYREPVSNL